MEWGNNQMSIQLIAGKALDQSMIDQCKVAAYVAHLDSAKQSLISNVEANYYYLRWCDRVFPVVVVNDYLRSQSYVASLFNTYILYSVEELEIIRLPKWLTSLLRNMIRGVGTLFNRQKMDRVVYVNNWLVSTNVYPKDFAPTKEDIKQLVDIITQQFPKHTICFRSLTESLQQPFMKTLQDAEFFPLASRQVYIFDGRNGQADQLLKHRDTQRDLKLKKKFQSYFKLDHEPNDINIQQYKKMYEQLYIEKYCPLNPQYSAQWLAMSAKINMIRFHTMYDKNDCVVGLNGIFQVDNVMSIPIFGYDCDSSPKLAYYRQLVAECIADSIDQSLIYHASSGVSDFKLNRGANAHIEYSFCYVEHLPKQERWQLKSLAKIVNGLGVKVMRVFKL